MKKFMIRSKTYDVLLQIKRDYNLKDGDAVIWWLLNEIKNSREASAKSETITKYEPVKEIQPVPLKPVVNLEEQLKPLKKEVRDIEMEIDRLLESRKYDKL